MAPIGGGKKLVQREQISILPPSLELLRKVESDLAKIWQVADEAQVRSRLLALNAEIATVNARAAEGPPRAWGCSTSTRSSRSGALGGLIPRKAKVAQTMRAPQVEHTRFRSHLVRVDEVLCHRTDRGPSAEEQKTEHLVTFTFSGVNVRLLAGDELA